MSSLVLAAMLAAVPSSATHFEVDAAFIPGRAPRTGEVSITFRPLDPDVKINEHPAPRLSVEGGVLATKPAPGAKENGKAADEGGAYLDTAFPLAFPVTVGAAVPKGTHPVKATVTYFYCSKRDGWCKKGTAPLEFAVAVR